MLITNRLYYSDCYLREFEARILKAEPEPRGFRVYLDRTAFYPESGGQPADQGSLGGIPVLEVVEDAESVVHVLAGRPPESETVKGVIDWVRRFDHMQQHTGQHLLSAAFEKEAEAKTVSFHMGSGSATIDLDTDRLGLRQIDEAEELSNQVVFEDREVRIYFRPASEMGSMNLRKPTLRQGEVRLVEVGNFDLSACGGTHVRRTGAVGLISVRKVERMKGQTRVEFVCGSRALRAARRDFMTLSKVAGSLSASLEQVPVLITKQSEELRTAIRAREKLAERLAAYRAGELVSNAPAKNGRKIVRHVFSGEEGPEAKMVAHAIVRQPATVALIGVKGKPATLFFSQSAAQFQEEGFKQKAEASGRTVSSDMGALLRRTLAKFGGKGGGTRDFAQGGGLDEDRLEEALALAESLID